MLTYFLCKNFNFQTNVLGMNPNLFCLPCPSLGEIKSCLNWKICKFYSLWRFRGEWPIREMEIDDGCNMLSSFFVFLWFGCHILFCIFPFLLVTAKSVSRIKKKDRSAISCRQCCGSVYSIYGSGSGSRRVNNIRIRLDPDPDPTAGFTRHKKKF